MGETIDFKYSSRIRDLREDADLYQKDIADYLGVKVDTYANWERIRNDIPIDMICKIANYYHTSVDYLLELSNNHVKVKKSILYDKNILCKRLELVRKKLHYTQEFAAKKIGFNQSAIANYEAGYRLPNALKLLAIAKFYNVSMDYLLGRSNNPNINKINSRKRKKPVV